MFYFVLQVISKLMENRKIANATHNMYAYRIKQGELQQFVSANITDGRIFQFRIPRIASPLFSKSLLVAF